jgi:D-3-phosphoglycerate dehydrogenase / 2-oxoglutarate reductase
LKIWKNTSTLNFYDEGLIFTKLKHEADIVLLGGKPIALDEFVNLKGIFRAGIGRDNVPEKAAKERGIKVVYPSHETMKVIYNETAVYTCSLILRMLYNSVGLISPWTKFDRPLLQNKILLVIGTGNIGGRVVTLMKSFMKVITFDLINNDYSELSKKIKEADCITLHIPKKRDNELFMNEEKLKLMKNGSILINTARGSIVDENALYEEIKSNRLTAAFDTFWKEPYNGNLIEFYPDKFYMSPHIAGYTDSFLLGCRAALDALIKEIQND